MNTLSKSVPEVSVLLKGAASRAVLPPKAHNKDAVTASRRESGARAMLAEAGTAGTAGTGADDAGGEGAEVLRLRCARGLATPSSEGACVPGFAALACSEGSAGPPPAVSLPPPPLPQER